MAGLLLPLLLALIPSNAYSAGPGTSAATFLNLGFGARSLAMGEAYVSVADDAAALHYNPAGLALPPSASSPQGPREFELLVSHALHVQDIRLSQMGVLRRPFGFSATHLSMGGIERRTTETERPDGSFGASDLMLGFSYGRKLEALALGGTFKYIRQTIGEYSASAYAMDLGAIHRFDAYPVSLGFSMVNLGTQVRFIEQGYPLPLTFRLGATYGMTRSFPSALTLQVDFPRDNTPNFRIGMEYLGFGPFALRAGYRTMSGTQRQAAMGKALGSSGPGLSEFYGMFLGAGFRSRFGSLDYTLLPYGELGNAHRFSFTVRFGKGGDGVPGPRRSALPLPIMQKAASLAAADKVQEAARAPVLPAAMPAPVPPAPAPEAAVPAAQPAPVEPAPVIAPTIVDLSPERVPQ